MIPSAIGLTNATGCVIRKIIIIGITERVRIVIRRRRRLCFLAILKPISRIMNVSEVVGASSIETDLLEEPRPVAVDVLDWLWVLSIDHQYKILANPATAPRKIMK